MSKLKNLLPKPQGYRVLLAMPTVDDRTAGGIHVLKDYQDRESVATMVGNVIALGPDCYKDPLKFPTGPWCKEGDWVLLKSYAGTRFKVKGQEFRLVVDDAIEAVVDDPRLIERIGSLVGTSATKSPVKGAKEK